jgi:hypothetical protein
LQLRSQNFTLYVYPIKYTYNVYEAIQEQICKITGGQSKEFSKDIGYYQLLHPHWLWSLTPTYTATLLHSMLAPHQRNLFTNSLEEVAEWGDFPLFTHTHKWILSTQMRSNTRRFSVICFFYLNPILDLSPGNTS